MVHPIMNAWMISDNIGYLYGLGFTLYGLFDIPEHRQGSGSCKYKCLDDPRLY